MQTASSCLLPPLHPPVLLALLVPRAAGDRTSGLRRAQSWVQPIAQLLANGQTAPLTVLAVQPRTPAWRVRLRAAPAARNQSSQTQSALALDLTAEVSTAEAEFGHPGDREAAALNDHLAGEIRAAFSAELLATVKVTEGRPAATILNQVQQTQAGLVVVSASPEAGARELLSSVATTVARYAPCHLLVDAGQERPASGWQRVLLVVNSSRASDEAIALTRQIASLGVRQVTILHIQPPLNTRYWFGPFATATPNWQFNQLLLAAQQEQSQHLVQQAEAALNLPDLNITTLVQTGDPGALICQAAVRQQSDVIILSSDDSKRLIGGEAIAADTKPALINRSPLRQARLTATADYVLHHAPCAVLLTRATPLIISSKSRVPNFSVFAPRPSDRGISRAQ